MVFFDFSHTFLPSDVLGPVLNSGRILPDKLKRAWGGMAEGNSMG